MTAKATTEEAAVVEGAESASWDDVKDALGIAEDEESLDFGAADDAEVTEPEDDTPEEQPQAAPETEDVAGAEDVEESAEVAEENDAGETEPLRYEAIADQTIEIDGQVHKVADVLWRYKDYQQSKQKMAEERKQSESQLQVLTGLQERFEEDPVGLAVSMLNEANPRVAEQVADFLQRQGEYDPFKAKEANLTRREKRLQQDEQQRRASEQEGMVIAGLEQEFGRKPTAEEWQQIKAIAIGLHQGGNDRPFSRAFELVQLDKSGTKAKTKKSAPKTERATSSTPPREPSRAELWGDVAKSFGLR